MSLDVYVNGYQTDCEYSVDKPCGCCGAQLRFDDTSDIDESWGVDFVINDKPHEKPADYSVLETLALGEDYYLHINMLNEEFDPPEPDDQEW